MFVLPLPRVSTGGELGELLLSYDDSSEIDDLLDGRSSTVGRRSDASPCLTATRCLEALEVV
jgi:hypothetical protein